MNDRYKVIIANRNVYKEIQISPEITSLTIGTDFNSDVRLRKELFFGTVQLNFQLVNGKWTVICSDNVYFNLGDVRKLMNIQLYHGAVAKLCYQESDNEVFSFEFLLDFDYEKKNYDRKILLSNLNTLKIGGTSDAQIYIQDRYLDRDCITLNKKGSLWIVTDLGCKYGVYVNGEKITQSKEITDLDFISIVGYSFYYKNETLYFSKTNAIQVNGLNVEYQNEQNSVLEYPKFNRNTRIQYSVKEDNLEIQQPTAKPALQKKSILMTLIPTLVMLAMTIVLRGILGGGGTFVIYSVVSMGMGAIMSVITYMQDKKKHKKEIEEREKSYRDYIEKKEL